MTVLTQVFRLIADCIILAIMLISFMAVLESLPSALESVIGVPQIANIDYIVGGCYTLMVLLIVVDVISIIVAIAENKEYEREEVYY